MEINLLCLVKDVWLNSMKFYEAARDAVFFIINVNITKRRRVMKKLLVILAALLVITGCSANKEEKKIYKIGVLQLVDHPSLKETYDGMLESIDNLIGKGNYEISYHNAAGDPSNTQMIAQQLVDDNVDLIYAIATSAAQAVYAASESAKIPVVFNAVTDPVDAGLVNTMDAPGNHATGVSDVAPIDVQLALIKEILPEAKNIGILYNTGEDNSRVQIEIAEKEAAKLGLNIVKSGVSSASEIEDAATQLVSKVDALYNITDNMIVNATAQVVGIANDAKVPVLAAEAGQIDLGILGTDSIDYRNLGKLGGELIKAILVDGKSPAELSVKTAPETVLYMNLDVADSLGIELPKSVLDRIKN